MFKLTNTSIAHAKIPALVYSLKPNSGDHFHLVEVRQNKEKNDYSLGELTTGFPKNGNITNFLRHKLPPEWKSQKDSEQENPLRSTKKDPFQGMFGRMQGGCTHAISIINVTR